MTKKNKNEQQQTVMDVVFINEFHN